MDNPALTPEEERLRLHVPDDLRIRVYTSRMRACTTWREAEECVLVPMIRNEGIPLGIISRKAFYSRVLPFLERIGSRSAVTAWNHFTDMASLLRRQGECDGSAMRTLLSGGVELSAPQPGEEARYTVELVVRASESDREKLSMSALLVGVECRKAAVAGVEGERPAARDARGSHAGVPGT